MIVLRVGLFAFGINRSLVRLAVRQFTFDSNVPSIDNQVFALGSCDTSNSPVNTPS